MGAVYLTLAVLALAAQAYTQYIPPCAAGVAPVYAPNCGCAAPAVVAAAPAVIQTNSVAANLADTLSLLTVTTLLAETLPYGCPAVAPYPYPGCGCAGYGYVY